MRPKGLRNLRTLQATTRRDKANSHEQAVAELARLEHEKARLQRELDVWEQNRRRTEQHLQRVEARLGVVRRNIDLSGGEAVRRPAPQVFRDEREDETDWGTLSIEY